jgi:hypothetical protein
MSRSLVRWPWRILALLLAAGWAWWWLSFQFEPRRCYGLRAPPRHLGRLPGTQLHAFHAETYLICTPAPPLSMRPWGTAEAEIRTGDDWEKALRRERMREQLFLKSIEIARSKRFSERTQQLMLGRLATEDPRPKWYGFALTQWRGEWALAIAPWLPASLAALGVLPILTGVLRVWRARRRLRANRCGHCDYPLTGLPQRRCPECGHSYEKAQAGVAGSG